MTGSTYTFDSIFINDAGSFAVDTITNFKPLTTFSAKGEC